MHAFIVVSNHELLLVVTGTTSSSGWLLAPQAVGVPCGYGTLPVCLMTVVVLRGNTVHFHALYGAQM